VKETLGYLWHYIRQNRGAQLGFLFVSLILLIFIFCLVFGM
jgi:hypothetical protein